MSLGLRNPEGRNDVQFFFTYLENEHKNQAENRKCLEVCFPRYNPSGYVIFLPK